MSKSSVTRLGVAIPANGVLVLRGGTFFKLIDASVAVTVRFDRGGLFSSFENVLGGAYLGPLSPDERWDETRIEGAAGTIVGYNLGDLPAGYDRFAGTVGVTKASAGGQGNAGITNGANGVQIRPANLNRRVLHVFNNDAANTVYAGYGAALVAADGAPIPPGQERTFLATEQVRAIALVAGPINVRWIEEND